MNRVYVAHGEVVTVVDGTSGAIIGTVEGMAGGTHGIAIVNVLGKGYTDDGKAGTAVAFDLRSLTVLKQIKVDPGADGIVYDAPSGHVLVIEGGSAKIAVIDPRTDAVVATVDGGGDLEYAVSGGNGKLYVNGAEKNEIVRVDTRSNLVDAHWPMAACTKPHGLAIDRPHRRLFASCANKIMVVLNADSGEVLANVPIGDGTDFAEFDDKRGLAFSSNRDGTLSIVAEQSPSSFVAQPAVATEFGARTMALNPLTGRLYLVTADFTVNDAVPATDPRHRYSVKPGTTRLLFLDPATP
jgi:DNA-binding beta-propeller fold protein YncE